MASAAFHFNSQGSLLKVAVASGGSATATLDNTAGAGTVAWEIVSTDETAGTWTLSSATGTSITITAPSGVGKAALLKCTVNGGNEIDPATGASSQGELIKTAKLYIAPEVGAAGETNESDATYGYCGIANPIVRAANGGGYRAKVNPLTPSAFGVSQDNYAPTGLSTANLLRLSASVGALNMTGLQAGASNDIVYLVNVGSNAFTLVHESASSSAANRFWLPSLSNHSLQAGSGCTLVYDGTLARWTCVSAFT